MKQMIFLNRPYGQSADDFRQLLLAFLDALPAEFISIRLALDDDDVALAKPLAMLSTSHPHDAVVSLKAMENTDMNGVVQGVCALAASCYVYQVEEREPLHHEATLGRVEGMCQIAMFKKPVQLSHAQWLDIWLNSHTQIAIDTQSTFSYRQNIVSAVLPVAGVKTYSGPGYDAIVEEQFPAAAMTDRSVFFGAPGDTLRYKANEKAMFESVMRFIDFTGFECLSLSEYRVR